MNIDRFRRLAGSIVVLGVATALATSGIDRPLGEVVPEEIAASLRGGACPPVVGFICPTGQACPAVTLFAQCGAVAGTLGPTATCCGLAGCSTCAASYSNCVE